MSRRPRRARPNVLSRAQYRQTVPEHDLQAAVMEYLRLNARLDVYYFAIPNAAKRSWKAAALMKAEGLTAGVADLCIMLMGGRTAWLELKTAKGTQRQAQINFQIICTTLGHPYYLVRTLEDAIAALRALEALKGDL